jgi:hypothetical protein
MKYRKLRIAWSVACGVLCLLLVVLWVRSYWYFDTFQGCVGNRAITVLSAQGQLRCDLLYVSEPRLGYWTSSKIGTLEYGLGIGGGSGTTIQLRKVFILSTSAGRIHLWLATWALASASLIAGVVTAPCVRWRFSLRTLLIGMTAVAAVLGLVIWAAR